jgi:hypothetical protein
MREYVTREPCAIAGCKRSRLIAAVSRKDAAEHIAKKSWRCDEHSVQQSHPSTDNGQSPKEDTADAILRCHADELKDFEGSFGEQVWNAAQARVDAPTPTEAARKAAEELDRLALLRKSRGDRPLTDAELKPVIDVLSLYVPTATRSDFRDWWAKNHPYDWWTKERGESLPLQDRLLVADICRRAYESGPAVPAVSVSDEEEVRQMVQTWDRNYAIGLLHDCETELIQRMCAALARARGERGDAK